MTEISQKKTDKALKLYEKAQDAFKRNNYNYAINLLFTTVELAPQFVKARHLLHLILKKKLESSKFVILDRIVGNIVAVPFYLTGLFFFFKPDYAKAMFQFEKILLKDPVNTFVLSMLGACAVRLDMVDTAIDTYETIKTLVPRDIKNLKLLGDLYKDCAADLEKAKECYSSILQYDKENHAARKALSDVAALQTIEVGSYDDTSTSFLSKVKNLDYTDIAEKKMRAVKSKEDLLILIKDTEQEYRKEPKNVKIIIELASYYLQAEQFDTAIAYYKKARATAPEDYTLTKLLMDAQTLKIDNEIAKLVSKKDAQPHVSDTITRLETQKSDMILHYLKELVEQRPTDRELRFQLGGIYFERGEVDNAIKQFQVSVSEPRYKLKSYNFLGLCFSSKKMYDLAEIQFNSALAELSKTGRMDAFTKEVTYNLATVYENMGQTEKADEKYKEIYKVDISFKDVADKIRRTYRN